MRKLDVQGIKDDFSSALEDTQQFYGRQRNLPGQTVADLSRIAEQVIFELGGTLGRVYFGFDRGVREP